MPLTRLITVDGREIPLADVDITRTVEDFNLPPADVAAVIHDALHNRKEVKREQITASQAGNGARQLYLEETIDYATNPQRRIAALRGTMKHALAVAHEGLRVEERITSNSGSYSAKFDSYVPSTGVLRDAKFPNVFKVIMILKHGVETQARDYVLQLNVTALILKQQGNTTVNEMWLDFSPSGVGKLEKEELANKYGIKDPAFIPVKVPFLPEAEVWNVYETLMREKAYAHKTETVPGMCTSAQTWGGKKCQLLPGGDSWCPVASQCHEIAKDRGEVHPRDKQVRVA